MIAKISDHKDNVFLPNNNEFSNENIRVRDNISQKLTIDPTVQGIP